MNRFQKTAAIVLCGLLAGCSLPRGAAIESEVLSAQNGAASEFAVEAVTRDNLERLNAWPATGWHGHYHWFEAHRGPMSNRLQPGDIVNLTIWDSEQNSLLIGAGLKQTQINQLEISPSGEIFVPYVGQVRVAGLTTTQARTRIQEKAAIVTSSAQVQMQLQQGPSNTVDLVGGVATPGSFPLPNRNTSLTSLIAQGGGISPSLRHPIVRLSRGGKSYEIPARSVLEDSRKNVILRGRDQVVIVDDERYFTALGATGTETQVFFTQEEITALEALSMIGGLNDARGNPKGVLILREYPQDALSGQGPEKAQTIFTLDLTSADGLFAARNFKVNPEDILLATESPVTSVQTVFGLLGSAIGIGRGLR